MNRTKLAVVGFALVLTLSGCASDSVLFVTKTSLSILEADTKPAGISVAYDRVEGYLGPTSESGEAPPVLGYFGSDGNIFAPKVKQVYATGNAARILTNGNGSEKCTPLEIQKPDRVMFFGTSTTSGLKVGFFPNTPMPDSFVFGWRRKEFSMIPLSVASADRTCDGEKGAISKGQKFYPATLASINSMRDVPPSIPGGAKLADQQYFATGDAATGLAGSPEVKNLMKSLNKGVFDDYYAAEQAQKTEAAELAPCYAGLRPGDRPQVWDEASRFQLFQDDSGDDTLNILKDAYAQSVQNDKVTDADRLARADRIYMISIMAPGGSRPERASLLAIHKKTVCDLSKLNKK